MMRSLTFVAFVERSALPDEMSWAEAVLTKVILPDDYHSTFM